MHKATSRFWNLLEELPQNVKHVAEENIELLKHDPSHPSLHFKKVGQYWSARIGSDYRALAYKQNADYIWVWIGSHDEYLIMLKRK